MIELAIIGGTGLTSLQEVQIVRREIIHTPYGEPSAPLTVGRLADKLVVFLPRHGDSHTIPPHQVNYRANIWALHNLAVKRVVAVAAVGGIRAELRPGQLVIPAQIIDYTWSRAHTFFEGGPGDMEHVDFTEPYCEELRQLLIEVSRILNLDVYAGGTYAATQGPRLETAAEIDRLEQDGCDLVGMTGMPEAALAREIGLCYATCAVVANLAAGRGDGEITMAKIEHNLVNGMEEVRSLLESLVSGF